MTKKRKRYLRSWAVAHALAYDVPGDRPSADASAAVKKRASRGLRTFHMALARGTVPPPDMRRGKTLLWDEEKFERWKEDRERETKKAAERVNAQQPSDIAPTSNENAVAENIAATRQERQARSGGGA